MVLMDEPGLFVYPSPAGAVRDIEPPDAEVLIRAAYDDAAVPYRVEWLSPNRHSRFLGIQLVGSCARSRSSASRSLRVRFAHPAAPLH